MDGQMMHFQLTLTHILKRVRQYFPNTPVVSRGPGGAVTEHTWAQTYERGAQLANALVKLGVKRGDRVATLAWNNHRHLEAYFAVPMLGAVVHTLNLRLHPSEIGYIANHAEDSVVLVDRSLLPLFRQFSSAVPSLRHVIVLPDTPAVSMGNPAGVPQTPPVEEPVHGELDYEELIAGEPREFDWPELDEWSAAQICYTSGTTGKPKGVVYSHRSSVLHSYAACMADAFGISMNDIVLPCVPMFHANAWGLPYACAAAGASLVLPGPSLDPESLLNLMAERKVTFAGGVPTIWLGILALLDQHPKRWDLSALKQMVIGGSAAPPALIEGFEKRHGLNVIHAWGMTETNPIGTIAKVKHSLAKRPYEERLALRASQGFAVPFVETRVVDDAGKSLPWDATSMGELEVRGPWVAGSYLRNDTPERWAADGWFKTGDMVTIDAEGYLKIRDRSKDVIKSGGEWISSVDLENALMGHPAVKEAAVFAGRHPKWDERPIAAVVLKDGAAATESDLEAYLAGRVSKIWLPDAYVFVEQIPRTSTGKFLKTKLRELYGGMLEKRG